MKHIILATAFAFFSSFLFAQKYGYISYAIGSGIPVGEFASKDITSKTAGWAKNGFVSDINMAVQANNYFGFSGKLRRQYNPFDDNAYKNELLRTKPNISVTSDYWSTNSFMLGIFGSFPVSNRTTFHLNVMYGASVITLPQLTIMENFNWTRRSHVSAITDCFLAGISCQIDFNATFFLLANADFMYTNPDYITVEVLKSSGFLGDIEGESYKVTTFNLGLGLGVRF